MATAITTSPRIDPRCKTRGIVLCVSKIDNKVRYMKNGAILYTLDARFGRPGFFTREGTFSIFRKVVKDWSYPYHVWMPYTMYFSGGEAIHYSYDFAQHGYATGSHGCVNLRSMNGAQWLYNHTPIGTKVVIYSH